MKEEAKAFGPVEMWLTRLSVIHISMGYPGASFLQKREKKKESKIGVYARMGKAQKANESLKKFDGYVPSPDEVEAAMSQNGGWTAAQLAKWGVGWRPPHGWREALRYRWENNLPGEVITGLPERGRRQRRKKAKPTT
jgi:ribosomal protein L35AE/L33A